ncbi:hypothetical protein IAU60_001124 [Kwoniella sp. DSM 27419]
MPYLLGRQSPLPDDAHRFMELSSDSGHDDSCHGDEYAHDYPVLHEGDVDDDVDGDDDDDSDSVQVYKVAPEYLRRRNNRDNPIILHSSDTEDEPRSSAQAGSPVKVSHEAKPGAGHFHTDMSTAGPSTRRRSRALDSSTPGASKRLRPSFVETNDEEADDDILRSTNILVPSSTPENDSENDDLASPTDSLDPEIPDIPNTDKTPNLVDLYLAQVVDVLPDIDPTWAARKVNHALGQGQTDDLALRVVDQALDLQGGYPKKALLGKGKGKAKEEEKHPEAYKSLDYKKESRLGGAYLQLALFQLGIDFPLVPVPHIRTTFFSSNYLYTPTYYLLLEESEALPKPYSELKRPRMNDRPPPNVKSMYRPTLAQAISGSSAADADPGGAIAFEDELTWLRKSIANEHSVKEATEAKRIAYEEAMAAGGGIECGCCFGEDIWDNMFQCAEGHLFCKPCATQYAETKLGEQSTMILCMDVSGCPSPFPESELRRLLSDKSFALYHHLRQAEELEVAAIEGLESCPSCAFAVVIDNPDEKLFHCQNEECGRVTCRSCKREDHIPRTCAEVEADLKLNNRHVVEDAMSEALIRRCPKCAKPYVKDDGCNKIICSKCRTMSCYICQRQIQDYTHFNEGPGGSKGNGNCPLWDRQRVKDDQELILAARAAAQARVRAEAREAGIELGEHDLDVEVGDLPRPPPAVAALPYGAPRRQIPVPAVPPALDPRRLLLPCDYAPQLVRVPGVGGWWGAGRHQAAQR